MKFTEDQLRGYEEIMQQIPNYQKGGGKRKGYTYTLEDCDCEYCLYRIKNKCIAVKCCLEDIIECITK